jgi:signal transduction histidine kinase/DNA-binding NarL/FixJ family response regulator
MLEPFADAQVLVIDDNEASATLLQMLLSRARVRTVHVLTDPLQALERLDELGPDLVLLDLHMPRMDGYTLLTRLRERASAADLPVVVLTADTSREATRRALSLGANDFLTKPLDTTEVLLRVRNLLESQALHRNLQQRQRWLEASGQVTRELLSGTRPEPLRLIAEHVRELSDADLAVTTVPDPDGPGRSLLIATREGIDEQHAVAVAERVCLTLASRVISEGRPLLVDGSGPDESSRTSRAAAGEVDVGHVMVLPLVGAHSVRGALALCRRRGRPRFTDVELETATSFANQAAMALELADARADQERVLVLEDRHRIARDLHDHVIQRLFATGLRLETLASSLEPGELAERIGDRARDLDNTISEIRTRIFQLRAPPGDRPGALRWRLLQVVAELTQVLGFEPRLHFLGAVDTAVPEDVAEDVVAAAREALTNVARHAHATHAEISLLLDGRQLNLDIVDDGVGVRSAGRRSGLTNLAERADARGGSFAVDSPAEGGTRLSWSVPLRRTVT